MASAVKKTEFVGKGCFIQGIGLLAPFIGGWAAGIPGAIVGVIVFVVLFLAGSIASSSYRCSDCGNALVDSKVKLCPSCKATLSS